MVSVLGFLTEGLVSTGEMIDALKNGDRAEYRANGMVSDLHIVVEKQTNGAIIVVSHNKRPEEVGKDLALGSYMTTYKWQIKPSCIVRRSYKSV